MSVLVTGAAGFAGGYLLEHLRDRNEPGALFGLTRHPPNAPVPDGGIRWLMADLCDPRATEDAVQRARPTVIYHLAAQASGAAVSRELVFQSNVETTRNLIAAAAGLRAPVRVMLASTGYVYGRVSHEEPATEESPVRPEGVYAESKVAAERAVLETDWGDGVTVAIARAFNHTGPRQLPYFAVPSFARQLALIEAGQTEPILRVGNLDTWRDLGDVRDVVRAYASLTRVADHGEAYNVCTGRLVRMGDVLDALTSMCRTRVTVVPDADRMRSVDMPINYGSARRLETRTGWRAEISLAQTLRDTLDWWRRNIGQP